jgi:hypothetical protein
VEVLAFLFESLFAWRQDGTDNTERFFDAAVKLILRECPEVRNSARRPPLPQLTVLPQAMLSVLSRLAELAWESHGQGEWQAPAPSSTLAALRDVITKKRLALNR